MDWPSIDTDPFSPLNFAFFFFLWLRFFLLCLSFFFPLFFFLHFHRHFDRCLLISLVLVEKSIYVQELIEMMV